VGEAAGEHEKAPLSKGSGAFSFARGEKNMATFYISTNGTSTGLIRQGSKETGLSAHIRTWDFGIEVYARWNEETNKAEFEVFKTGGSSETTKSRKLIGIYSKDGEETTP